MRNKTSGLLFNFLAIIRKGKGSLHVNIAGLGNRASISPFGAVSDNFVGFFENNPDFFE
jgi:hypothetical protein